MKHVEVLNSQPTHPGYVKKPRQHMNKSPNWNPLPTHPGYAKKSRQHMIIALLTTTLSYFCGTGSYSLLMSYLSKRFNYTPNARVLKTTSLVGRTHLLKERLCFDRDMTSQCTVPTGCRPSEQEIHKSISRFSNPVRINLSHAILFWEWCFSVLSSSVCVKARRTGIYNIWKLTNNISSARGSDLDVVHKSSHHHYTQ